MGLMEALGRGRVALHTAIFIYFIEEHPKFLPLISTLFAQVAAGKREIVTSSITLLEELVIPYRAGNLPVAERYEALLTGGRLVHPVCRVSDERSKDASTSQSAHPSTR
jgi:hypothetical protein